MSFISSDIAQKCGLGKFSARTWILCVLFVHLEISVYLFRTFFLQFIKMNVCHPKQLPSLQFELNNNFELLLID